MPIGRVPEPGAWKPMNRLPDGRRALHGIGLCQGVVLAFGALLTVIVVLVLVLSDLPNTRRARAVQDGITVSSSQVERHYKEGRRGTYTTDMRAVVTVPPGSGAASGRTLTVRIEGYIGPSPDSDREGWVAVEANDPLYPLPMRLRIDPADPDLAIPEDQVDELASGDTIRRTLNILAAGPVIITIGIAMQGIRIVRRRRCARSIEPQTQAGPHAPSS